MTSLGTVVGGGFFNKIELRPSERLLRDGWAAGPDPAWYGRLILTNERLVWISHRGSWSDEPTIIELTAMSSVVVQRPVFIRQLIVGVSGGRFGFITGRRLWLMIHLLTLGLLTRSSGLEEWARAVDEARKVAVQQRTVAST